MRLALAGLLAFQSSIALASDQAAESACLSPGDAVEIVTAQAVVAPREALGHVRRAVPDSDVLRAALCREPDRLVYRVVLLTKDGRIVRVTVDAPSGQVKTVH
jgi:uncharacterized membrane protein YkoI